MRIDWPLVVSGLGNLVVAAVALFGERFRSWLWRPDVKIESYYGSPFLTERWVDPKTGEDCGRMWWFRIRILNRGKSTARGCKVKLAEATTGDGEPLLGFEPLVLGWVSPPWGPLQFHPLDIAVGECEFCNVLSCREQEERFVRFEFDQQPRGCVDRLDFRGSASYVLTVTVYGDNFEPVSEKFRIAGGGYWEAEWDVAIPALEIRKVTDLR